MSNDDHSADPLVEQLHAHLVEALTRLRPDPLGSAVTVAEIYQDLVPYRSVRTHLGIDMNADYEHTLLRLLGGVDELARLEPKEARDELRAELKAPNPNVGVFRKFAGCDVWIAKPRDGVRAETIPARPVEAPAPGRPDRLDEQLEWPEAPELLLEEEVVDDTEIIDQVLFEMPAAVERANPAQRAGPPHSPRAGAPPPDAPAMPAVPRRPAAVDKAVARPTADAANGRPSTEPAAATCAFCHSELPAGRRVRFCPFCGMDQSARPCPSCSEPLDAHWRYCIACGGQAAAGEERRLPGETSPGEGGAAAAIPPSP